MNSDLDFALLDDVLPLLTKADQEANDSIRTAQPRTLGPLVEYTYQARIHSAELPPLTDLLNGPPVRELCRVFARGGFAHMGVSMSHQAKDTELHWVPPQPEAFSSPGWVMFQRRLQNAAEQAGFTRRVAAGLTGAFGEMVDNAFRHSLSPSTAVAGYHWSEGTFEYVVADAG